MGLSGGCTPTYRGYNPFCIIGRGPGPPCKSHVTFTNITLTQNIHFKIVVVGVGWLETITWKVGVSPSPSIHSEKMSTESTGHVHTQLINSNKQVGCRWPGDNWMYPYHPTRAPVMGNPYISRGYLWLIITKHPWSFAGGYTQLSLDRCKKPTDAVFHQCAASSCQGLEWEDTSYNISWTYIHRCLNKTL